MNAFCQRLYVDTCLFLFIYLFVYFIIIFIFIFLRKYLCKTSSAKEIEKDSNSEKVFYVRKSKKENSN